MKRFLGILTGCIVFVSFLGCASPGTPTGVPAVNYTPCTGPAITIGDISDDPDEVITGNLPLANYIAERLGEFGIECGKVIVHDTVDEMIEKINNEEVDIYMDSLYPAALVSSATGAQPILRRWRNCDPEYYSVIFTTKDSGITTVKDLPGHMVAMDRSYSTSGFALPATYLMDLGLKLVVKDAYDDPVAENEIGIFFSLDDKNTLNLILEGKVSAGTTDDFFFKKWEIEAPGTFVLLAETSSVPRQVVLVRQGMESDLRDAIKDIMVAVESDPDAVSVLEKAAQTCKFDDSLEGIGSAIDRMQAMHNKLKQIPGWQEAFIQGH